MEGKVMKEVQAENKRLKETYKEDGQKLAQFQSKQIELTAHNLQLVGALEAVSKWWKTGDNFDRIPMEQIDNALSGDGVEKYQRVLEALFAWYSDDTQLNIDHLAFAVQDLQSAGGSK